MSDTTNHNQSAEEGKLDGALASWGYKNIGREIPMKSDCNKRSSLRFMFSMYLYVCIYVYDCLSKQESQRVQSFNQSLKPLITVGAEQSQAGVTGELLRASKSLSRFV